MARDLDDSTPLETRDELIAYLESGCKPASEFRIGTEHEKFGFYEADCSPVPYEGERGIGALLHNMQVLLGWEPVMDGDDIIGLVDPTHGGAISLEPGGQFELSGAPLHSIHQTCREVNSHLAQLREVAEPLGIGFLGLGFSPKWTRAETPRMPKQRYDIMTAYMQKVGTMGLDMMYRTCTVQVNLDFASEADMVKKMRVGLALQPIATALFANSPFKEGKPNGFLSLRSEVWKHTDADRTGMLPFVFDDGFGFEAYADYALNVPLYFVKRGETYHDVAGDSFRDLMDGKLAKLPGVRATQSDWVNHLTTIFPEVRLKKFIEMRGADGGPWRRLCALPALWVGLMYDGTALDAAWDIVKDWTAEERETLRDAVPATALKTPFRNRTVQDIAKEVMAIAHDGLKRRAAGYGGESDETRFLEELCEIAESGVTPAERMLEEFHGPWKGDIDRAFEEYAY
ncbi:glutamate--cysteine ligase [Microbaculum marinisediminis]|uniref:Glutamate--cysteine ligase n=1 Tax=Microbaculum marinisediminis TaxID=2931392 RepID=A0AAW5QRV0_9HYPH|nr:glutamate--cysteine ligase [Microbaculum sp. A6E488]MCT8970368.1 glutamate--cysteine ligase [Microbaculum sp. A6E488]